MIRFVDSIVIKTPEDFRDKVLNGQKFPILLSERYQELDVLKIDDYTFVVFDDLAYQSFEEGGYYNMVIHVKYSEDEDPQGALEPGTKVTHVGGTMKEYVLDSQGNLGKGEDRSFFETPGYTPHYYAAEDNPE